MFRNILVCIDGSPEAGHALTQAIDLADCEHSRLTILTAVTRPPCWATTPMTAAGIEPLAAELAEDARRTLERAVARVPGGIPVTKILSEAPIRKALTRLLREDRHDLIVLGSRGHRPIFSVLHRSVRRHALRHGQVPVLAVRAEGEGEPGPRRSQDPAVSVVVA